MIETKTKFKVDIFKNRREIWSFGICLMHHYEEIYVYINFFRWRISIGKLYTFYETGEEDEI